MASELVSRRTAADSHIVMVGLMGTGKSTVGALLADSLRRQFFDNDILLERRTGHTAAALQRDHGDEVLHRLETDVLIDCLSTRPVAVIAAAASTVLSDEVIDALRGDAFVIWLRTDLDVLAARLVEPGSRPLTGDFGETLAQQDRARAARFASIADIVVDTSEQTAEEIVHALIERLGP